MRLPKYSIGIGDRFAHQGKAQLAAIIQASKSGAAVAPVWNKSHREHSIVGSVPADVRAEADAAARSLAWTAPYFVDADHIGLKTVDRFIESSDFFTLDVADFIGTQPAAAEITAFADRHAKYIGRLKIPGIEQEVVVSRQAIEDVARRFLVAVREAAKIYRHVEQAKGADRFVTEVSMDETASPQTPLDLLFVLAAIADEGVKAQTIAPRFSGRFNKGVEYVGDVAQFTAEFRQDLAVIAFAVAEFGLPDNLKLSIHSGSDKFALYGPVHQAMKDFDAGIHLKTAGTTWLAELTGLAMAGGEGLEIAKECYCTALSRCDELCGPYASVIDIDVAKLPSPETVRDLSGEAFAAVFRHDQACPAYNANVRQLLHVAYKVAAEMGDRYTRALDKYAEVVQTEVTENLYRRHLCPLLNLSSPV